VVDDLRQLMNIPKPAFKETSTIGMLGQRIEGNPRIHLKNRHYRAEGDGCGMPDTRFAREDAVKQKAMWLAAALALVPGMGSDWLRPTTRPPCLPGIPDYAYKEVQAPPPGPESKQGLSFDGVEIGTLLPAVAPIGVAQTTVKLRTFAMDKKDITIQHCSVSQLAFTFGADKSWVFNCRADQNPWFTKEPSRLPAPNVAKLLKTETNHLLRNEFKVIVRCYGNFMVKETNNTTGKPALVVIQPDPFMVQRGVPYVAHLQGSDPGFAQYYGLIDRVEFEFSYR
jgi:hypothetical protein